MEEEIAVYLGMEVTGRCCGGATRCGVGVGEAIIKPSARYYGPQLQLGFKMGLSIGHWAFRCLPRAGARSLSLCCSPPTRTNSSSPSSLPPPPTTQNPSPYLRSRAPNPKASPIPGPRRNGIAGLVPRRLLLRRFRRRRAGGRRSYRRVRRRRHLRRPAPQPRQGRDARGGAVDRDRSLRRAGICRDLSECDLGGSDSGVALFSELRVMIRFVEVLAAFTRLRE
jgi:hypothetical protein